jgi:hypothetical protein
MKYERKEQKQFRSSQKKPGNRRPKRALRPESEMRFLASNYRKAFKEDLMKSGAQIITNSQNQEIFLLPANVGGEQKTITLQQKMAFGGLGEGIIQVRAHNRQLLTTADWMVAFDKKGVGHAFPTNKLKEYLAQCWGTVSRHATTQKRGTLALQIRLEDFFRQMKISPIQVNTGKTEILKGLEKIKIKTFPATKPIPPWRKRKMGHATKPRTYGWGAPTEAQMKNIAEQFAHPQMRKTTTKFNRRLAPRTNRR